jgi:hypothetical protein
MRFSVGFSFAVRELRDIVWLRERPMPSADSATPTNRTRLRTRDVLFLVLAAVGFAFFSAPPAVLSLSLLHRRLVSPYALLVRRG